MPIQSEIIHRGWKKIDIFDLRFIFLISVLKWSENVFFPKLEGSVSVISSDTLCKDANARFTTVPLKPLSARMPYAINIFNFEKLSI